jgi:ATP-grasp domain, R2K clade family 3
VIAQCDVLHVDDTLWVATTDTRNPAYDFAFSQFFSCRRSGQRTRAVKAVARLGALREYESVFQTLHDDGVTLVNSPTEHRLASELPEWYPHLVDVTPRSVWFERLPDADEVARLIGWPVFVKGARQTSKHSLALSVAQSPDEYARLVTGYQADPILHWQPCVLRELVPLRPVPGNPATEIPASFEFRTFWWRGQLVGAGRYWTSAQPYQWSPGERQEALAVASEVARRLAVPFLVVDVAQLTSGRWMAIECNDAQESGYAGVSPFAIWQAVIRLERKSP